MASLICRICSKKYSLNEPVWQCVCGGLLDLHVKAQLPVKKLKKRPPTMWRYREVLPVESDTNIVSMNEGFTPLIEIKISDKKIFFKQDYLFPTGSFKDRGASVLISKIKELGIKKVIIDSSGNAGCAVAAYCTRAGIECLVLVPENTSEEKLTQIRSYGAKLFVVQGTRDETAQVALEMAEKIYYASHYYNPFFFHGTKTFAYEICEQLEWQAPDTVVFPLGNGTLFLGAYIGFNELYKQNIINKIPRFVGIQTKACAPLFYMLTKGIQRIVDIPVKSTIAEGIAVSRPPRAIQLIEIVKKTKGTIITVSESEIIQALKQIYQQGIYIEPTSGAGVAGVKKYLKISDKKELIVSTLTGHGLKSHKKI
ncbi:MAG: threonine synthase [bacterium]